ncbi:MAG: SEC-C domain-containing protein [Rhodocyclales bacterium]|nr:SEC-C domain-containing protein [Rhodocyclales bacterium]
MDDTTDLEALFRVAVDSALSDSDFVMAFARFRGALPAAAPDFLAQLPPDADLRRAMCFAMFREIWKATPRPDRNWRPLPAPKPERNAPCLCGSGRKFKQCCGAAADMPPFGEGLSVLGFVLERLPVAEFAKLPFKQLDPEEVAHTADEWMKRDRHDLAVAVLEALLADPARLDERHEWAFDLLGDAYVETNRPGDRAALVEVMLGAPNLRLRVAAMQRRCTMLADADEYDAAWSLFREAQRADPDNPSLAHLELVMLASQDEMAQLAVRARFWAGRLRKLGYEGEAIVDFIDDVARNPEAFAQSMAEHGGGQTDIGVLERLVDLVDDLPAPTCHYRLQAVEDNSAGPLKPDAALARVEREWREASRLDEQGPWDDTAWLEWLEAHPVAWQSFDVLDDLVRAVNDYPCEDDEEGGLLDDVEDVLLDHAVKLLRLVIAENRADGLKLEWGWLENRPALRLLAQYIELVAGTDEELPLLEWLVLTLNPNDNLGLRERLIHLYCHLARPADALAVCDERYPDDGFGFMRFGRLLALILLGREAEATAALAKAGTKSPRILKTLLAARPRRPAGLREGLITVGGEDEAWFYRQHWRAVWEKSGALAWLRRAAGGKG